MTDTGLETTPAAATPTPVAPTRAIGTIPIEVLQDVELRLEVVLGRVRLRLQTLLEIRPGQIIELDRTRNSPVEVLVNGTLFARGEVVVVDESHLGVRIGEVIGAEVSKDSRSTGSALVATARTTTLPDVSIGHLFMQMVIAIAVIGGGIWAFGKVVQHRKASGRFVMGRSLPQTGLRVLSRTSLGKDQHLAVVAWGDRQVLVGVSGSTIALLADASEADAIRHDEELTEQLADSGFTRSMAHSIPGASGRPSFIESLRTATLRS